MTDPSLPPVSCMVAMDTNRGIGIDGRLPWPSIKKDYEYYIRKTSEVSAPDKKVVRIKGRATWEDSGMEERAQESCINILVSNSLNDCPEHVHFLAGSFEEALQLAGCPQIAQQVEHVWVMGGVKIYEAAVNHPRCERIYLTRVMETYEADKFFPPFEDKFQKVNEPSVDGSLQQDNGISFMFEVYERKS